MKLKTLLLSSAAAFAVVGGAQAADLSVAEPVNYVKVCDAFGAGYWYIPGTDTCLKIGGLVRMDIKFYDEKANAVNASISADPYEETGAASYADHRSSWDFATEYHLDVVAKTMTEFGPLTAFAELRAQSNNADASNNTMSLGATSISDNGKYMAYLDSAYLELGMLLVGRTGSVYDYSGGFNWDWMDFDSDSGADQVRLTWAMSGFGIQLAIEDPRDRWGTDLTRGTWGSVSVDEGLDADGDITTDAYTMPNIVGNVTWSQGNWSGQLSGGFAETRFGSGFGAQIGTTLKLDQIAPGDRLMLKAAWAENQVWKFAASTGPSGDTTGSVWSMAASFQHFWSPILSSAVTFQYYDQNDGRDDNAYSIVGNLVWAPVTGFFAGVEGGYHKYSEISDGTWGVKVRLERDW